MDTTKKGELRKNITISFLVLALVFISWAIYRLNANNQIIIDELIVKPIIWLAPTLIAVIFLEKNNLSSLGFTRKNLSNGIKIGFLLGLFFALERIVTVYLRDGSLKVDLSLLSVFSVIVSSFFTGFVEEIFFRGYLLNRWLLLRKYQVLFMILNGLIFTATHLPYAIFSLHYSGYNLFTYILSNFITGFVYVFLFYKTRNIFAPITGHIIWNTFSGLIR